MRTLASLAFLLVIAPASSAYQWTDRVGAVPGSGRVLWLRADAGVERGVSNLVGIWQDQSGLGNDLVQEDRSSAPLWVAVSMNGRPALQFDGNDWLGRADGMPTGDYTKVVVVALDEVGVANNVLSGASTHALHYGAGDRARMYHAGDFVTSTAPTALGTPTVLVATYAATSGEGRIHQDGVLVGEGIGAPNTADELQLGAFAGANFLRGRVAEVMVYDRALGDAERISLESYLAAKYRSTPGHPAVELSLAPRDGQLYQRDASNQAQLAVAGTVSSPGYASIELEVLRDDQPWAVTSNPLDYEEGAAPFQLAATLGAGLHSYDLRVSLIQGEQRTLVAQRDNLLCGDALIVAGQSNAVARDVHDEGLANRAQSKWIRSFGSAVRNANTAFDQHWDLADGQATENHSTVGAWGLRLAELLVQRYDVPIAVVNGAVGGTAIYKHLRDELDPTDLRTIYGRLLWRAREAGIEGGARAILWYQGESDGENTAQYALDFAELYAAWHEDYAGIEKVYVFQIRKGCGVVMSGVREVLRRLPEQYADIEVMSTTASSGHDGCHYYYEGYRELGNRISRVVSRDLYGSTETHEIDPPNLQSATFLDPSHDKILLTFEDPDDELIWDAGSEQYLLFDDATTVFSGTVINNTILLQLSAPSTATTISYDGHVRDGPWIRNARGVGALTFFDVPIDEASGS